MAITDNAGEFDALAVARRLEDSGFGKRQAEAVAGAIRDGRAGLATKADLAALGAGMRADLYRALWIQGAGIIGIMIALKLFG